ncbi:MAG: Stf0 family sulfotransferase [Candidatus Nanopelagicales bacterium]|nr:Stf0 family sulfotransferase [Candidatus Nanopelagicales bacterium]
MSDHPLPLFVVGSPRTGSTLLSTLLLQHPSIEMHGELFHPVKNERRGQHALGGTEKRWFNPRKEDAIDFLDEYVFSAPESQVPPPAVIGLKVFAEHVRGSGAADLLPRIREHYPDAAVLHIRRDDYLSVLISLELAKRTKVWVQWSSDRSSRPPVRPFSIRVGRALEFFEQMQRSDDYFATLFAGPNYLSISYESLVAEWQETADRIFALLGLDTMPVQMVTDKQVLDSDLALIRNHDALHDAFETFRARAPRHPGESERHQDAQLSVPTVDLTSSALRLSAQRMRPAKIARQLGKRHGIAVQPAQIAGLVRDCLVQQEEWLTRPLDRRYAVITLTAAQPVIRDSSAPEATRLVVISGVDFEGGTTVLGIWPTLAQDESIELPLSQLRDRGVCDAMLVFADDGLYSEARLRSYLPSAIGARGILPLVADWHALVTRAQRLDLNPELARILQAPDPSTAARLLESLDLSALESPAQVRELLDSHHADLIDFTGQPHLPRRALASPRHLQRITAPFRGAPAPLSNTVDVDAAISRLYLVARSLGPDGTGRGRWRIRHTAELVQFADAATPPADASVGPG